MPRFRKLLLRLAISIVAIVVIAAQLRALDVGASLGFSVAIASCVTVAANVLLLRR